MLLSLCFSCFFFGLKFHSLYPHLNPLSSRDSIFLPHGSSCPDRFSLRLSYNASCQNNCYICHVEVCCLDDTRRTRLSLSSKDSLTMRSDVVIFLPLILSFFLFSCPEIPVPSKLDSTRITCAQDKRVLGFQVLLLAKITKNL